MKKLTVLCSALLLAATSFAAVEYVLPDGAVTNDYGWTSKKDMYEALNADWNTFSGATTTWKAYEEQLGVGNSNGGIPTSVPNAVNEKTILQFFADDTYKAKWGWLPAYLDSVAKKQYKKGVAADGTKTLPSSDVGSMRFGLGNFFGEDKNHTTDWLDAVDMSNGEALLAAYQPVWKHAYANPTEIAEGEFTLNAPYKEGESFRGWYDNQEGSGTPITKITSETTGKLYACFGEYINTVAEVLALADGTETKVKGTVTYTAGDNFWIQDASGAILCYGKNNGVANGDEVTLSGNFVADFNGSPELNNATVISKVAGTAVNPTEVTLPQLVADEASYLNKLVAVKGVKIVSYEGDYNTPYVSDGINKIALYKYTGVTVDKYPVGTQINFKAVFSVYKSGDTKEFQFRGEAEWIEASAAAVKDDYAYPARGENGEYTLVNNWIYSVKLGNYADNRPGEDGNVRGMAAKDGKMYFIDRGTSTLQVYDGATGKKLDPITITGDHLFQVETIDETGASKWESAVTLPFNDIKVDNKGNFLIGACLTSSQTFFIYKVDLATGAATEVIKERLWDNTEEEFDKISYRFDAFGVYGDVDTHAVIMAQDANSMTAFKWVIDNGVAAKATKVVLYVDPASDNSYLINDGAMIANPGTAPQIFPVDDNYFYLDGNATLPTLFNMDGTLADDFKNCAAGIQIGNNEGDTCKLNQGHNGLAEFQVGDEYFLVMAATNTAGTPSSAFALYKYKDASKSFADMTPLWFFPNNGMSFSNSVNGFRSAVPSVDVKDNVATIYLYTGNCGFGVYTFTGVKGTGFNEVIGEKADNVQKVMENGQIYILKDGVRYNVLGTVVK